MKTKAPAVRRQFANAWDEINYLRDKVLFWLYQREQPEKALPFAKRLQQLLDRADAKQEAILGQECRSLAFEAIGDFAKAIEHRQQEINYIRKLQEISRGTPGEDYALKGYGSADLSDRLDLLAVLYRDNGELGKAITTLRESRMICEKHGIEFDGADLLEEYLKERRVVQTN